MRNQRGVTLIEALVALLVMSFGMLALVGLMGNLHRGADNAKQRSEAMRLARESMAKARGFSELTRGAATPAASLVYDEVTSRTDQVTPADSNTTYTVQRLVTDLADVQAKQVRVNVSWTDRAGDPQFVNLDSVIAAVDPVFSAAIGFAPPAGPITQPSRRSPRIPVGAKPLDAKISAFSPSSQNPVIWVFDNLTGVITGRCANAAAITLSALTAADVASCKDTGGGYLLSGTIRFSNTSPPNPTLPEAFGFPLRTIISNGTYYLPRLDAHDAPIMSGGAMVLDSFPATAPAFECFNDSTGVAAGTLPFVTYNCLVTPDASTKVWSGRLELADFNIGTTAADYRVCRYSADYNGNGSIYTADLKGLENEEHPDVYAKVARTLTRQNFLVVRGDRNCPTAPAIDQANGIFADYSTLQLQP